MKDKILNILINITLVMMISLFLFMSYHFYHLYRFDKCYRSEFSLSYCENYREY